jgi:hypothetical protein
MPNEFVSRNGFISKNDSVITGSLTVTNGIYGNILSASYSETASYSLTAATASYVISAISASYSDYAETASYTVSASAWEKPSYTPTVGNGYIVPTWCLNEVTGSYGSRPGLDNILLAPFLVHKRCKLESMVVSICSSGSGVPTTCSLGIYSDNGDTLPKTLLQSLGTAQTNVSTTFQHLIVAPPETSQITLNAKTMYWAAIVGDNALVLPIPSSSYGNQIYNPILQVDITASAAIGGFYPACKNIGSYGYVSASAGNPSVGLPTTLPQTATSYTVNSYLPQNSYLLPLISVTYG